MAKLGSSKRRCQKRFWTAGNRVGSTTTKLPDPGSIGNISKIRTEYLTDSQNPTGYSQVLTETEFAVNTDSGVVGAPIKQVVYTIGHDQISQTIFAPSPTGEGWGEGSTQHFGTDGHGSVRVLYNAVAAIVQGGGAQQLYHFDAYGNLLNFGAGTLIPNATPLTTYLYSGEAFDFNIGQQYLRARWYDPTTGRFNSLDPFAGNSIDPQSFHKYAYVHGDPIQGVDPSGEFLISLADPPQLSDVIIGGLVGLVSAYAARLEWAVEWLQDSNLSDDLNPFADNLWVTEAIFGGAIQPWLDYFNNLFSVIDDDTEKTIHLGGVRSLPKTQTRLPNLGDSLRANATIRYNIGSVEVRSISVGKGKGWVHHTPSIGKPSPFNGPKDVQPDGRLVASAKAYRERNGLTGREALANRNIVVAKIRVNGKERIMVRKSDPNRLHSEEILARDVDRLRQRGFKVKVDEVFTERIPCNRQGCRDQLRTTLDDANTFFHTRLSGSRAANELREACRW